MVLIRFLIQRCFQFQQKWKRQFQRLTLIITVNQFVKYLISLISYSRHSKDITGWSLISQTQRDINQDYSLRFLQSAQIRFSWSSFWIQRYN
ncbi:hypothetical protein FGO68_gene12958 [Halteria grandinella]|uniref:Uncharacterized protein n=1 Tax=Halteria grandinella TaxID=5974 RepID=A0A8J8P5T8_HALGN|nr:hypothetical protein FGO68_gene12958 [Halteria grandinella]